jgi:hypothetical protein
VLRPRLLVFVLLAAIAAFGAGCARKQEGGYKRAKTEGLDLGAGHLKYQIQLSRSLNPKNELDRSLLRFAPTDVNKPSPKQEWFGIWLRVENDGKKPQFSASRFEILDSLGKRYKPIPLDAKKSPLYYTPVKVNPKVVLPDPDSVPGQGGPRGLFLLFKLDLTAYQNRPLEFRVIPPVGDEARVELDL